MMSDTSNRDGWLSQIKEEIQVGMGEEWDDECWTEFIREVAWWLVHEQGRTRNETIKAAVGLITCGVKTKEDLFLVAGNPPDDEKLSRKLEAKGVSLVICAVLFNEYVHVQQIASLQQQQQRTGMFTVFVRNHNLSVTNVIKFHDKRFPSTVGEFWEATGLEWTIDSACVTVKMLMGWEKLSDNPKNTANYAEGDPSFGIMFQLSPYRTPTSSPISDEYISIQAEEESNFAECIQNLFRENPFNAAIPELYEDGAIRGLRLFFQQGREERTRSLASEVKTLALIFAMPGAGKTRTVQEAAHSLGLEYHRFKMSNANLSTMREVRQFLLKRVATLCDCETNAIPLERKVLVLHFDEIQSIMRAPRDDGDRDNSLVTTLAKECDALINKHGENQRSWLKFVMTGTNIFSDTQINVGSQVKTELIPMGGSFSHDFVCQLARKYNLMPFFAEDNEKYLERCRHNRRFTERFFCALWDKRGEGIADPSVVDDAYHSALSAMSRQIAGNMGGETLNVSSVACTVFAKILDINSEMIVNGIAILKNCSMTEKSYIAGGGLNVKEMMGSDISIFYPAGCVLELLERLLARTNSRHSCNTVISFLRVSGVLQFGIKGHLFEWLVAYDISSPRSEFDALMPPNRKRLSECIGAVPLSCPKVYEKIAGGDTTNYTWIVLDQHNAHQNRWIDFAYSIEVPAGFKAAYVIVECKTGYKKDRAKLKGNCETFFAKASEYAGTKSDFFFMAVFACEHEFNHEGYAEHPRNLETAVAVVNEVSCPTIARFLCADHSNSGDVNALVHELTSAVIRDDGAKPYPGGTPCK